MGYVNNNKQRDKTYLINNLGSSVTNLGGACSDIASIILALQNVATGTPSGLDVSVNQQLSYAEKYLENARKIIFECSKLAQQLRVEEEGDNGGGYRNYY